MSIKDRRRFIWIPQLYIRPFSFCCYGNYTYNPDGGGFGVRYGENYGNRKNIISKYSVIVNIEKGEVYLTITQLKNPQYQKLR